VISLYYYLQVMREVFISPADEGAGRLNVPLVMQGLAVALMLGVFYVGIYPTHLFEAANNAATFLFA
jgi:NADH:ubiquinone oxidoreductase subunit 2 (subunit N)